MGTYDELEGRVVLVTGAARGIGAAAAAAFAVNRCRVVVCDILAERGEKLAGTLRQKGAECDFIALDVTSAEAWKAARDFVDTRYGHLNVLVNNAAINIRKSIMDTEEAEWRGTFDVNLVGAYLGMRTFVPLMRGADGPAIVNVSSTSGIFGQPDAAYSASKWALRGLTKTAAIEFGPLGIRANSIHPGTIPTEAHLNAPAGHGDAWRSMIPLKRPGSVSEIANAIVFAASDHASYVNGVELIIDGGLSQCGLATSRASYLAARSGG